MAANNRIRWEGLQELVAELRKLPEDLRDDAGAIVEYHAFGAGQEIENAYPFGPPGRKRKGEPITPGNLRAGMDVQRLSASRWGINFLVINRAKHAWMFEHGTKARHYFTVRGKKKLLGRMPAGNVFIPRMIKWRHRMYDALKAMLERHGLQVSGDA